MKEPPRAEGLGKIFAHQHVVARAAPGVEAEIDVVLLHGLVHALDHVQALFAALGLDVRRLGVVGAELRDDGLLARDFLLLEGVFLHAAHHDLLAEL